MMIYFLNKVSVSSEICRLYNIGGDSAAIFGFLRRFYCNKYLLGKVIFSTKQLFVVADDAFYAQKRDAALVECLKSKTITNISVLINGKVARNLVVGRDNTSYLLNYCSETAFLPGLHINLSEGIPVSNKEQIPSLIGSDGLFYGKAGLRNNLASINLDQIELEVERQLLRFKQIFGSSPLHVDGHHHIHVLPGFVEVLSRVLPRHGVKWIRLPEEPILNLKSQDEILLEFSAQYGPGCLEFYQGVSRHAAIARSSFHAAGLRTTDAFVGMLTMGKNLTKENLRMCFSAIDSFGTDNRTVELMTHPGFQLVRSQADLAGCSDQEGVDEFSCSPDRDHERRFLQSREFSDLIDAENLKLSTFGHMD